MATRLMAHAEKLKQSAAECPKCYQAMAIYETFGVPFDHCEKCGGSWLDREELRKLKDRCEKGSWGDLRWLDHEVESLDQLTSSETSLACPTCKTENLCTVTFPKTNIKIDVCHQCFGVWLDRGEFDQIINHLNAFLDTVSSEEMRSRVLEEVTELLDGRESIMSEALDIKVAVSALINIAIFEHPKLAAWLMGIGRSMPK